MPLPRFSRLPDATRTEILRVARTDFARHGFDGASYNKIIGEAGISKTSAYHYFDGKADLYETVMLDVAERIRTAMGEWTPAAGVPEFWDALAAAGRNLLAHLAEHTDDRALLARRSGSDEPDRWITALVSDAVRLGLIAEDEQEVMRTLTPAVVEALDRYALDQPDRIPDAVRRLPQLLARLWDVSPPYADLREPDTER